MPQTVHDEPPLAERVRRALTARDLGAFGSLLSDDVRWGEDGHPRSCRGRSDVLATFSRLLAEGADGEVTEVATGSRGVVCGLSLSWPTPDVHPDDRQLFHVYLVRDDRIVEIQRYDDRRSAEAAAGLIPGMMCAECGCLVDHGVRTFTCCDDECCCRALPITDEASTA